MPVQAGAPSPGVAGTPTPGVAGTPPPGVAGTPTPGVPSEPTPGDPRVPPPGGALGDPRVPPPGGSIGVPTGPARPGGAGDPMESQGPSVAVAGTVSYAGYKSGKVKITAFDADHSAGAGQRPKVVGMAELEKPGAFSFRAPASVKVLYVEAVVDEDGDGRPGPLDPQGQADRYPLRHDGEDVSGLAITLGKREPPPGKK